MRAGSVKFPRCLKQLKELDHGVVFILIGNNTDHFERRR